jgi:FtsP/CotA-like multicopper oxidase with cupredoxin domain
MKKLIFILGIISVNIVYSQHKVSTQLFSKMDFVPQFTLWDGNITMLMGFTSLMGTPIDIPGPTLIYTEGDSVELKLRNMSQSASHTIHLHGLDVNQQNDGVPHLSFEVGHNETESYFFKAPHPGTYLYHCHVTSSLHVQAGMYGMLIVKPQNINETWDGGFTFDKEYAWMTSEIDTVWHTDSIINHPHDTTTMMRLLPDYNPQYFFVNGRSENQLSDSLNNIYISATANETVLLRLANIGYYGNRFIFPNQSNAKIISSDGRPLPNIEISDTLEILPGERYQLLLQSTIEFIDSITIQYFNLNSQIVENTQNVPIEISGFASVFTDNLNEINVYPNPVTDFLYFQYYVKQIDIYNINGSLICSANNSNQVYVSHLEKGIYFVKLNTEIYKFIKL